MFFCFDFAIFVAVRFNNVITTIDLYLAEKDLEVLKLLPSLQTLNHFPNRLSDRNHRVKPILATESLQVFLRPN